MRKSSSWFTVTKASIITGGVLLVVGLLGLWYLPRKAKQMVLQRLHAAAGARGITIESAHVDVGWSQISLTGIRFRGEGYRGRIDRVSIASYKITSLFPVSVRLGKVKVVNLGFEGARPRFARSTGPAARKGRIQWKDVELEGLWLELKSAYGRLSVEDGRGRYTRGKGGDFVMERLSVDSPRVPVYFIDRASVSLGKQRNIERIEVEQLVWKISDDLKLFTKRAALVPQGRDRFRYELIGRFLHERGELTASGEYNRATGALSTDVHLKGARVGFLIPRKYPVEQKEKMLLSGDLKVSRKDSVVSTAYRGKLTGVSISHRLLADRPLNNLGATIAFEASYDDQQGVLEVSSARVTHKKLRTEGWLRVVDVKSTPRLEASLTVPPVGCQDALDSLPVAFFPNVSRFKAKGTFRSRLTANIDFAHLDRKGVRLGGKVDLDRCRVTYAPPYFRTTRIRRNFDFTVIEPGGQRVIITVDEQGENFTPLDKISPYMMQAVLTTEDGRFFRHRGFITSEFSSALAKNLRARKFKWGASSITMQVVKNVFLKRRKTLSRKLEELFLTWHVERYVRKQRLMEIYLNIIELGPDIYGVTRAARHFFGKEPEELTLKEAIYFASVLPSPKKRYHYFCKGEISSYWDRYLNRLLKIMYRRGRITKEELDAALLEKISFDHTNFIGKYACTRRIRRYRGR